MEKVTVTHFTTVKQLFENISWLEITSGIQVILFGYADRTLRETLQKRLEETPSNALCFVKRLAHDVLTDHGRSHGHRTWYRGARLVLSWA